MYRSKKVGGNRGGWIDGRYLRVKTGSLVLRDELRSHTSNKDIGATYDVCRLP